MVLGADIARKNAATIGGTVRLRGVDFTVVGILEADPDAARQPGVHAAAAAQELYVKDLPADIADKMVAAQTITHIVIYPKPGADVEALAERLEATLPNVTTLTASEFDETIGSTANLLSGIIVGVGFISLIVGGLSVVNTMAMSVNERTREIGIKRAIGGTRRRIILELVTEAGLIGFIGGVIGLALGALVVYLGNRGGPGLRNGSLQPDGHDGPFLRRLRDRPRDGRRGHPRHARGAARSRPGPSARIGADDMALLEAQNLRKTFHLGDTTTSWPSAAST